MNKMKGIYFFCSNPDKDPVAPHVFEAVKTTIGPVPDGQVFDGNPVLEHIDENGNRYCFAETEEVFSHNFTAYLPECKKLFDNFDFAGFVNWHAGANAPDDILTVHSIGDVPSGYYAPTDPMLYRNMLNALNNSIKTFSLKGWRCCTEATHWSGIVYGNDPALIPEFSVPSYDIEIGSSDASWSNPTAAKALASALIHVFDSDEKPKSLLAAGGVHFEQSFSDAGLLDDPAVMCGHILPNQWLVSGNYNEDGFEKMLHAVESIVGGIDGVVFHDNLAGPYKAVCRSIAEHYSVPAFKHKVLRNPARIRESLC